ncbi:hypothetical protein HPB49_010085 [Dermacentor silvarum]|uniref:Uncharacterized protein n=1 Tax=Dermacentor silvarum TaxID=543639 RepID=A0ACB8CWI4_DERSI|nr:hypothetical protein HPB49_010085 [Dermacentor silvarum]
MQCVPVHGSSSGRVPHARQTPLCSPAVPPTHYQNMSAHINAYIVEPIIPPRTLGVHRVNNGRSISPMCSRNVSNAESCVPHLDQHIVSLGRLRALCGIRTNRQRHQ